MKLLIACDMEGATGVCTWDHVTPGHAEYERFRRLLTGDVNAAIAGAAAAGATDIQVTDGHWNGANILIEQLDPRGRISQGTPSPFSMAQGSDSGVDAALFIAYHARVGSLNATLDHTWSATRVANLWINGRISGEFGLNGSVCGHFGVPVLMVSGDQTVTAEAKEWSPKVRTAVVKHANGRFSATCLPPEVTGKIIRETAEEAVRAFLAGDAPEPIKTDTPVTLRVEFVSSNMADSAALMPGAVRLDGRALEFTADNMANAFRSFRALVSLGG